METTDQNAQLKQTVFMFWLHLAFTLSGLALVANAFDGGSALKKTSSAIGFVLFLSLTVFLFLRMRKLQKLEKIESENNTILR